MSITTLPNLVPFRAVMYVDGMERRVPVGHRLSVIRWKTPQEEMKNKDYKKQPTICVAVPIIPVSVAPTCLQDALSEAVGDMQDAAVRAVIVTAIEENTGISITNIVVPVELGSSDGLAAWLAIQAASGRLSKASLSTWFDSMLATPLTEAVVARLSPTDPDSDKIAEKQVMGAKRAIVELASPRAAMAPHIAKMLLKAVNMAPSGDKTKVQLVAKLELFANPKPVETELFLNLDSDVQSYS